MLAAPGSVALKLPTLLRSLLLAPAAAFEELDFSSAVLAATHDVTLDFVAAREGVLRGLVVHIVIHMGAQGRAGRGARDSVRGGMQCGAHGQSTRTRTHEQHCLRSAYAMSALGLGRGWVAVGSRLVGVGVASMILIFIFFRARPILSGERGKRLFSEKKVVYILVTGKPSSPDLT